MNLLKKIKRKRYKLFHPAWGEVLMLHRVVNKRSILFNNRLMEVTPAFLEKTILDYKNRNYQFISLDELYKILSKNQKPNQKFVCFTFDDGYVDNLELAYPIFKKYNCPFAIYVATDFPNHKALLWWYVLEKIIIENDELELGDGSIYDCRNIEKKNLTFRTVRKRIFESQTKNMKSELNYLLKKYSYSFDEIVQKNALTWEQIKLLSDDSLCTISSHTVTHAVLDKVDSQQLENEIKLSKQELEKHTHKKVVHFAYTYGRYNTFTIEKLKEFGYRTAVLANGGEVRGGECMYKISRKDLTM